MLWSLPICLLDIETGSVTIPYYKWSKSDWDCYRDELRPPNWLVFYDSGDVNTVLQSIVNSPWTAHEVSI